ncbi:response regulator [Paenibacillus sp. SYP-B4298]|uniref:response regulator n=1 Tax=Paenibacillus sp. SYP-B4298 TaxID=2996034 RepID=UPI0022DDCC2E|nr:response regulator [Paenibacillus sp. SYP-B4298]
MKAILIDDEELALLQLERLLLEDGRCQIIGKHTSAKEGLAQLSAKQADIVFLDIGMPGITGLEAAEKIREIDRNVHIVYITAYSDYALEAFELQAIDYLLKPVSPARFAKTLNRIEKYLGHAEEPGEQEKGESIAVQCFQRIELSGEGKMRWRTSKTQELFALLVHYKNRWIPKEQIMEELWSDFEQERAVSNLHTSVYQIRKLLKDMKLPATVEYGSDSYRLSAEVLVSDVDRFESTLQGNGVENDHQRKQIAEALQLYRGDYLAEHDYAWAESRRRELLQKYLNAALAIVRYDLEQGREERAVGLLEALQAREPYSEEICRLTLTCYAKLRNTAALRRHYETFEQVLSIDLGIRPSQQTEQRYRDCMEGLSG